MIGYGSAACTYYVVITIAGQLLTIYKRFIQRAQFLL